MIEWKFKNSKGHIDFLTATVFLMAIYYSVKWLVKGLCLLVMLFGWFVFRCVF